MIHKLSNIPPVLAFEEFPFFVGVCAPNDRQKLPKLLPFCLAVDPLAAIPRLIITPEIDSALEKAYGRGSFLSTPLGEGPLANDRMQEMLGGLLSVFGSDVSGRRFIEIGCGFGNLLNELKSRGADVMGCEIGPQGDEAFRRYNIPVIRSLQPCLIDEPFDCVFSYGCLEHIVDLAEFLATSRSLLKDDGLFFHSVPNMDSTYATLRIEELCHEHVSYFTAENATRLLDAQGFRRAKAVPTRAGNEMHMWGFLDRAHEPSWPGAEPSVIDRETAKLAAFAAACSERLHHHVKAVEAMLGAGESIGLYAGGYVIAGMLSNPEDIRFFDGDHSKHGLCWLSWLQQVRDPETLRDDPVDNLIICPDHYFTAIHAYLVEQVRIPAGVRLHKLSEIG